MTCNCDCNDQNAIILVRGNDTDFNDANFLTIYLNTEILDLSTFKAVFKIGGITKNFDDISEGKIELNFTAQETSKLPAFCYGQLNLIDTLNRIATIESLIPFKVISVVDGNAIATQPYTLNFDVKQGGENILNVSVESAVTVTVGTTTTLPAGSNATVENVGTGNHLVLNFGIPKGVDGTGVISVNGKTGEVELDYSDVGALSADTTIGDLTTASQLDALNSGANSENIGQIAVNASNITSLADTVSDDYVDLNNKINSTNNHLSELSGTVTSNYNALDARITTNTANIATNAGNITTINSKIPNQASSSNQLADKAFVNSSIATNTAYFIGTFNSVAELEAYSGTLTNNDYAFVATTDTAGNTLYDRYKYNADTQEWMFEYELNNSSFTAAQWASINSGIDSNGVAQITLNQSAIGTINTTLATFGNIVTHNVSEFATAAQGTKADTALQPNDNISDLYNDVGYTTNEGTVTSVNNVTPDANGNVALTLPDISNLANKDLSNLSSAGNAKFQAPLVSGVNIKTINNTSILGGGNIEIQGGETPTNMVTTNTAQNISGRKTFIGEKAIYFKQSATTDKLGFTLYSPSDAELAALEWRPNTISGNALLALNCPQTGTNYVGFRYWANINIVAPRPTTNGTYFIPVNITNGTTTVTANSNGTVNINTLIPTIATSVSSTSTNAQTVGAKLFYDTVGDIERALDAIIAGSTGNINLTVNLTGSGFNDGTDTFSFTIDNDTYGFSDFTNNSMTIQVPGDASWSATYSGYYILEVGTSNGAYSNTAITGSLNLSADGTLTFELTRVHDVPM